MIVLGVSGRDRDAAAAVSVDGRVVAAASEDSFARIHRIGYGQTGGFPSAAAAACLRVAGVDAADVDEVVVVADSPAGRGSESDQVVFGAGNRASVRSIDPTSADAVQALMSDPGSTAVFVCDANPPVLASFAREGSGLGSRRDFAGADGLAASALDLASVLGLDGRDPFAAIDRLSVGSEPEFQSELAGILRWSDAADGVVVEPGAIAQAARRLGGEHAGQLGNALSLNARVQQARGALAASFTAELARVVAQAMARAGNAGGPGRLVAGGGLFGNGRFNTELARIAGTGVSLSAVPEAFGRALGAVGGADAAADAGLAIGPSFSEEEIKRTLDNCRLDYVYEPDWARLLGRVSKMLAQGKIVGWFQGPMAFGPRALGTRSILADPANRYARQNLNEYLRDVPLDEPLPVVVAPSVADQCFADGWGRQAGIVDAEVRTEWRTALTAALDWRRAVRIHGARVAGAPRLADLLELHYRSTGTPGLIETNLAGAGEPVACTPRDAVRTVYSSAIDALVIGRFLLMKDYWLLRTRE